MSAQQWKAGTPSSSPSLRATDGWISTGLQTGWMSLIDREPLRRSSALTTRVKRQTEDRRLSSSHDLSEAEQ